MGLSVFLPEKEFFSRDSSLSCTLTSPLISLPFLHLPFKSHLGVFLGMQLIAIRSPNQLLTIIAGMCMYFWSHFGSYSIFSLFLTPLPFLSRRLPLSRNIYFWHIQWAQVSHFCKDQEIKKTKASLGFETLGSRSMESIFIPKMGEIASVFTWQCQELTRRWCLEIRSLSHPPPGVV